MTDFIEKGSCIFERDDQGRLLPVEQEVLDRNDKPIGKALVLPLTKGEIASLKADSEKAKIDGKDPDDEFISKHLSKPAFTPEEVGRMKPFLKEAFSSAIIAASLGISVQDARALTREAVAEKAEDFLAKKPPTGTGGS